MEIELYEKLEKKFEWMNLYIECGSGWYDLIYKMCEEIEQLYKDKNVEIKTDLEIIQIKSKYAELRMYYNSTFCTELNVVIDKYVKLSTETCEECGLPGELVDQDGFVIVLCENCDK